MTVEPIPGGARLTQEESFSLPVLRVPLPPAGGWLGKLLRFIFGEEEFLAQSPESIAAEEAEMAEKLTPRLAEWLSAIKTHLEREQSRLLV